MSRGSRARRLVWLLPAMLTGCVTARPVEPASPASGPASGPASAPPTFDPIAFFAGETVGEGRLRIAFHHAVTVHVRGHGTVVSPGTLRLAQRVTQGDAPATNREWSIRRTADGRYAGTLTDAVGPVVATVSGNCLRVRFGMRHGLKAKQFVCGQAGGMLALNRLVVRKFGVAVAVLDERITRVPATGS